MIRLDAIPIPGLPQVSQAGPPTSTSVRVNCILHSGLLPAHQALHVLVNGVLQTETREGEQAVFAWQLERASDEVRIVLLNRGRRMKYWQGCWNERDAILHSGTLPVQVFFAGKPQPLLEALTAIPSSNGSAPLAQTSNGRGHAALPMVERKQHENHREGGREAPTGARGMVIVQDLLVLAASEHALAERERSSPDESQEKQEGDGMQEGQGEGRSHEQDVMQGKDAPPEDGERAPERGEATAPAVLEPGDEAATREEQQPQAEVDEPGERGEPLHATPARDRRVVPFHAGPQSPDKTLASLKEVLATLPAKTLVVDVRPKERQRKKDQPLGLAKSRLHAILGAKYWDRSWAIPTVLSMIPPTDQRGFSTWQYRVDKSEEHPDGIAALVNKLAEGYCLVVMDDISIYAQSRRRAVIEELHRQVADLERDPLG